MSARILPLLLVLSSTATAVVDPTGYRAAAYDLELTLHFDGDSISGRNRITVVSETSSLMEVSFDLYDPLVVQGVSRESLPLAFTRSAGVLTVELDTPLAQGDSAVLAVEYSGEPFQATGHGFKFGSHGGVPIASTFGQLWGNPYWMPMTAALNGSKPLFAASFTLPDTMAAVSNGHLVSEIDNGDGTKTVRWESDHPIPPYGIAVAVTNYAVHRDTILSSTGEPIPMPNYLYPEDPISLNDEWSTTRAVLDSFERIFGPYPFQGDQYAQVRYQQGGGMEHQTATFLPNICTGGCFGLRLHEMAHAWWGNAVTCSSYHHVWLNEGLATWAEAAWYEQVDGPEGYEERMEILDNTNQFTGSVYVSNPTGLANTITITQYNKGAWIVHMLRGIVGESDFWEGLHAYRDSFWLGSASTEDLQNVFEQASGLDLDFFFSRWVYGQGRPHYEWWVQDRSPTEGEVSVVVRQVQAGALFTMPLTFDLVTDGGTERFTRWDSLAEQSFTFSVGGELIDVVLDPENAILNLETRLMPTLVPGEASSSGRLAFERFGPNPMRTRLEAVVRGGAWRRPITATVYDVRGRLVRSLFVGSSGSGSRTLLWSGRNDLDDPVAPGVYFLRITDGETSLSKRIVLVR